MHTGKDHAQMHTGKVSTPDFPPRQTEEFLFSRSDHGVVGAQRTISLLNPQTKGEGPNKCIQKLSIDMVNDISDNDFLLSR